MTENKDPIQEMNEEASQLTRKLVREARFGALGVMEAGTGHPFVSRTAVATAMDGAPIFLMSELSGHTQALIERAECSLLLGEPGKGDPLAHPRITLIGRALLLPETDLDYDHCRWRYLTRHPKAALYADFGDFAFYRMSLERASLNGGFGKAFAPDRSDLVLAHPELGDFVAAEPGVISHMNDDHSDAITHYAVGYGGAKEAPWRMTSLDPLGVDLIAAEQALRINFDEPLKSAREIRATLVKLAQA